MLVSFSFKLLSSVEQIDALWGIRLDFVVVLLEEPGKRLWHVGWLEVGSLLLGDVLVNQIALQDRVCCSVEDGHKDASHDVRNCEYDQCWKDWRADRGVLGGHAKNKHASHSREDRYADLSDKHEHI